LGAGRRCKGAPALRAGAPITSSHIKKALASKWYYFILTPPGLFRTQALLGIRKACDFPVFRIFALWIASITWQKVVMTGHPHLAGKVGMVGLLFLKT
jgi:hypothetical protein